MIAAFMVPQEPEKKPKYVELDAAINAVFEAMADGRAVFPALNNLPAADVRPVVRGRWQSWEQDKPPCKWYSCDYCGFHALSKSNYCPNCGADMRGES